MLKVHSVGVLKPITVFSEFSTPTFSLSPSRVVQTLSHRNIISVTESFFKENKLYFVTDVMQDNLNNIIRSQRFKGDDIRYIIYQILNALNYLHKCGIVHGDLKPNDIGINRDFHIKIIDLNVERPRDKDYVLTKW